MICYQNSFGTRTLTLQLPPACSQARLCRYSCSTDSIPCHALLSPQIPCNITTNYLCKSLSLQQTQVIFIHEQARGQHKHQQTRCALPLMQAKNWSWIHLWYWAWRSNFDSLSLFDLHGKYGYPGPVPFLSENSW